jgi:aryl-alcohol dehydrogenase-like predicted oxidoreductase
MIDIRTHLFGKSNRAITIVGLGGEGVLRTYGRVLEAVAVIDEAVKQGITYFDCAQAYAGSEGYYGHYWPSHQEIRAKIFQASKSASRDREGALADLDNTLKTMGIDHLDLWQIHDVRTREDIDEIEAKGGALEAFLEAKKSGKAKHIGVTGHHDPSILTYCIENWPVESVMLPVNPVEGALGGFLTKTLPAANKKGLAVIAMKVLGHGSYVLPEANITAGKLIQYALSQGPTVAIVGCMGPQQVRELADEGREFQPMGPEEQRELVDIYAPHARRLAYYRGVF